MNISVQLIIQYMDNYKIYNSLPRFRIFKKRKINKLLLKLKEEIEDLNEFDFTEAIYILLSTVLYDKLDMNDSNITINNGALSIKYNEDTFIWFSANRKCFDVYYKDITYTIYRDTKPTLKIQELWNEMYPRIFNTLFPIITMPRREKD